MRLSVLGYHHECPRDDARDDALKPQGRITIDGTSVNVLDPVWLRAHMAFVQQEPILFGVSVRENVAYYLSAAAARSPGTADPCKAAESLETVQAR